VICPKDEIYLTAKTMAETFRSDSPRESKTKQKRWTEKQKIRRKESDKGTTQRQHFMGFFQEYHNPTAGSRVKTKRTKKQSGRNLLFPGEI
jgi:hypothetical protein